MAVYTHPSTTYPALPWIDVDPGAGGTISTTATEFAVINSDGTETHLFGTSFTYDMNGDPTGGTVDHITRTTAGGGTVVEQVTGNGGGSLGASLFALTTSGNGLGPAFNIIMAGADTLTGNTGNDYLYGGPGADSLNGGAGTDIADYTAATVGLTVDLGTPANNTGDAIGDSYTSIEGIRGSAFNDQLRGDGNANTLIGGDGNDFLRGRGGADALIGGNGTDFADYLGASAGVTVNLNNPASNTGDANGDTFSSIEGIRGSNNADTLTGGVAANDGFEVYYGLGGNDTITGGTGYDEIRYDQDAGQGGTAGVTVNLATGTATDGFGNTDTLSGIEAVRGTNQADSLTGGLAANDISGEYFYGLGGNDTISGGSGFDEVRYDQDASFGGALGVTVNLATGTATDGFGNTDSLSGIQGVRGTAQADTLIGSNFLGFYSEDFYGLAGADTITGAGGFDSVRYDRDASFGGTAGVTVNLASGTAIDGFGNTDTLSGIEGARGTNQADTFTGDSGFNFFYGLGGADIINGGGGSDDEARYDRDADNGGAGGVTVNLASGTATDGFGNTDTLISIERARGTMQADILTGSDADNQLVGLGGNDQINGGNGTDEARYDSDFLFGGNAGVTVNLAAGTATDGFGNTDTLTSIENARGTRSSDTFTGSSGDNIFYGLAGNDNIDGGAGSDWTSYSNDIFIRYESETLAAVTVNLGTGTATDSYGGTDTLISIENATGGTLGDTLIGSSGDNIFRGLAGNDSINGAGGTDTVDYSSDERYGQFVFINGANGVTVNLGSGTGTDGFGNTDTLTSIENAIGTNFVDTLTGDGGSNVLTGLGGDDVLNGGLGADTLIGGLGNDTYVVDNGGDVVTENASEGTDTVQTNLASYTLGANVENLTFTDNGPHTGTGNDLNNVMTGGSGDDVFFAGAGSDTLIGGDGNDTLVAYAAGPDQFANTPDTFDGGNGNDTIYADSADTISGGAGFDVVLQINDNPMTIDMGATSIEYIQAGFGNDTINAATQTAGVQVFAGGGSDTITGSNLADFIFAGVGNDTVVGNDGADVILGDLGSDSLSGGAGNDSIYADNTDSFIDGGSDFDALYIVTSGANSNGMSIDMAATHFEFVADFFGGNDTIDGSGLSVAAEVYAAGGNDTVTGGSVADFLWGGSGNDVISGGAGNDVLVGESGSDTLRGGAGFDVLYGSAGGGDDGAVDTFVFDPSWGTDIVFDFVHGTDKLDMTALHITFADLTITTDGPHAHIGYAGNLISVANAAGQLTAGDFLF